MKTFSGRRPSQRPDELAAFIALLFEEGVRSYLEIGARDGDSFHAVMSALPPGSRGVAVDLPGGAWGWSASKKNLDRAVADLRGRGYEVRAIYGDSKALATRQLVANDAPFDALLIDGDHRFAGVFHDWENYGPMAGLVAFHDIDGHGVRKGNMPVEVPKLWDILRYQYRSREIIGQERGMGIGVVWQAAQCGS